MKTTVLVGGMLALIGAAAAATPGEQQRLRQQAQQVCYDDVQKLCSDAAADEAKVRTCMLSNREKLSPACRKVYDAGTK